MLNKSNERAARQTNITIITSMLRSGRKYGILVKVSRRKDHPIESCVVNSWIGVIWAYACYKNLKHLDCQQLLRFI